MVYYSNPEKILVKHKPTGEVYEALLLDSRFDGTIIFEIVGNRKESSKIFLDNDNYEVDTLFNKSWQRYDK